MNVWDFTRSPASARLLVDFGVERGVSSPSLLMGSGLSAQQLGDPNVEITAEQELRVTANLLRALRPAPAGLGFEVGARYHFSAYGIWGYGLIASATAGDALALSLRFLPLTYAYTTISYREEGALCVLTFTEPDLAAELKQFVVERDMAAAALLLKEIGGEAFSLARFTLKTKRTPVGPASSETVRTLFGRSPEGGAHVNSLGFDRALLNRKLPHADPVTVSMCEQMCERLMESRRTRAGAAATVRQYLNASPGGLSSTLEDMARLMNLSPRTLKRRLQEEGTTYTALLADARGAAAKELLRDPSLPLGEIAVRLGFSDLSTFSQAFKRWYGVAPSIFRDRNTEQR
ncbi:AraC family transcriptional regulator [Ralstonia insidiosa]|jgi:AraC-like DNA-binding protein|uniref:AraC family transcriptional regulator n=1 Tax=Ralstonia insidiosa TaxID=190721 RepID=A0A192A6R7_9RALS|nr:AraC family transcriptional regulator [Ralstonia insidiosa]ANJ76033.1 AraC family transcriptional regulator [Ralstonia insidiosa]KAB0469158.1 AraC family transcriptional regulator [Ralstonia insidiosa]MBY4909822.1 AraC family transcriptional regulator [Ralstonia insidiosa]